MLADRWNHVVDHRTSIAPVGYYSTGFLFLVDDGHMFKGFKESNLLVPVLQSFFMDGMGSDALHKTILQADPKRWIEE